MQNKEEMFCIKLIPKLEKETKKIITFWSIEEVNHWKEIPHRLIEEVNHWKEIPHRLALAKQNDEIIGKEERER